MIAALAPPILTPPAVSPHRQAQALPQSSGLAFALFVLLNFVLFVRPSELIQPLMSFELYVFVMIFCLLASLPVLVQQLWPTDLQGLTGCVIGLTAAIFLSLAMQLRVEEAAELGFDFFKVLLYYLLLQALVTDKARLRSFLCWMALFICISATVSVLDFQGMIVLPTAAKLKEGDYQRLRGSGIFGDPNDLCGLLCVGMMFAANFVGDRRLGVLRLFWLGPLAMLFYCLLLTQSRGGLLALIVGLIVLLRARWGWTRAALLGLAVVPVLLAFASERQGGISTSEGTGKARVDIWSDGLMLFRGSPIFGIGRGEYAKAESLVAHNSYIHAFAETGLLGGILFVGGFVFAFRSLERLCSDRNPIIDPEVKHMQPFVLAALASYMTAMFSLSLTYLLPTFTMLGLAAAFVRLAPVRNPVPSLRFDLRFLGRLAGPALVFLVGIAIFVRFAR